jgi:hypothetical protein
MNKKYQKYYLETNALRQLSANLSQLTSNCFTSGLSILELISGINEREFNLRKKVISNLFNSRIPIIWDLPEKVTARSFTEIDFIDYRTDGLKLICKTLIESDNLETLSQKIKNEKYDLAFFRNLDQHYSERFIKATSDGNNNLNKVLEKTKTKPYGEFTFPVAKSFVDTLPENENLNESITLFAITENLVDGIELDKGTQDIDRTKIYDSYNGNINIFIKVFSNYTANKGKLRNIPAKNDFIDLHHLMYLGNNVGIAIVTNDKMLKRENNQTLTIEEFNKTYT